METILSMKEVISAQNVHTGRHLPTKRHRLHSSLVCLQLTEDKFPIYTELGLQGLPVDWISWYGLDAAKPLRQKARNTVRNIVIELISLLIFTKSNPN